MVAEKSLINQLFIVSECWMEWLKGYHYLIHHSFFKILIWQLQELLDYCMAFNFLNLCFHYEILVCKNQIMNLILKYYFIA